VVAVDDVVVADANWAGFTKKAMLGEKPIVDVPSEWLLLSIRVVETKLSPLKML
jgi:hypothetical protein